MLFLNSFSATVFCVQNMEMQNNGTNMADQNGNMSDLIWIKLDFLEFLRSLITILSSKYKVKVSSKSNDFWFFTEKAISVFVKKISRYKCQSTLLRSVEKWDFLLVSGCMCVHVCSISNFLNYHHYYLYDLGHRVEIWYNSKAVRCNYSSGFL